MGELRHTPTCSPLTHRRREYCIYRVYKTEHIATRFFHLRLLLLEKEYSNVNCVIDWSIIILTYLQNISMRSYKKLRGTK